MFKELAKAVVGTVLLPVDITRDVLTLGGELTNGNVNTTKRLKHIGDNLDKATK
jgi:hypothetical protein